jgi:hypothetical protein
MTPLKVVKAICRGSALVLVVAFVANITGHGHDNLRFRDIMGLVYMFILAVIGWWDA